jgi:hypothetical protein
MFPRDEPPERGAPPRVTTTAHRLDGGPDAAAGRWLGALRDRRDNGPGAARRPWLAGLRRGLNLLAAFATLRDVEPPGYGARTSFERARRDDMLPLETARRDAAPVPPGGAPAASGAEHAAHGRPRLHPHRRPLAARTGPRRPGAVRRSPQPCLTPVSSCRRRRTTAARST